MGWNHQLVRSCSSIYQIYIYIYICMCLSTYNIYIYCIYIYICTIRRYDSGSVHHIFPCFPWMFCFWTFFFTWKTKDECEILGSFMAHSSRRGGDSNLWGILVKACDGFRNQHLSNVSWLLGKCCSKTEMKSWKQEKHHGFVEYPWIS